MIFEKVAKIIADTKGIDVAQVNESCTLESLKLDSLDTVQMLMEMESEFDIEIDTESALELKNVGDFIKLIESLK